MACALEANAVQALGCGHFLLPSFIGPRAMLNAPQAQA
jgi:hypothetical protein